MSVTSNFSIYNASAGSGKTFTLTLNYLSKLLSSDNLLSFRHILAITFTNKAVGEMKTRILGSLREFSAYEEHQETSVLFNEILNKTGLSKTEVIKKSRQILKILLDNYSAFEVSTIDSFTHKVIRTFAKDLNLSLNFDVELEAKDLLKEAVDRLISKVGSDEKLSEILIDFAVEKVNDDKSGDIAKDIFEQSKLLLNENDLVYVNALKAYKLQSFVELKARLKNEVNSLKNQQIEIAKKLIAVIESQDLMKAFKGSYLPKFFVKIAKGNIETDFEGSGWKKNIEDPTTYYNKTTADHLKMTLEELAPTIIAAFSQCKSISAQIQVNDKLYKNMTQLSVIQLVRQELELLKEEKNVLLISDFNQKINRQIKDQPTPFIYERLGEKFQHYFIDEFQDTSKMQWQNLEPLIENALTSTFNEQEGTASLVGDPKQSIYAWRGGDVYQFIDLINANTKIPVVPEILRLERNFRSAQNIVNFNNRFFEYASAQMSNPLIHEIYQNKNLKQAPNKEAHGLVSLKFIEAKNKAEENEIYPEEVLKCVRKKQAQGFDLSQICILVRNAKEGRFIANYLKNNEVNIISSETLLISANNQVKELSAFLKYLDNLQDKVSKYKFLEYHFLNQNKSIEFDMLKQLLHLDFPDLVEALKAHNIEFDFSYFQNLGLYAAVEYCISVLNIQGNAYVQFFLDEVFQFGEKKVNSLSAFLEDWEIKAEKKSISTSASFDALKILTIHKSKGLEFPVVIYPYASNNYQDTSLDHLWLPLKGDCEIPFGFINKPSQIQGDQLYEDAYQNLINNKELDNLNVLYVALTRASQELHILTKEDPKTKKTTYANLFKEFVETEGINFVEDCYVIGESSLKEKEENITKSYNLKFSGQNKLEFDLVLDTRLTDTTEAVSYGLLLHDLLAKLKTESDIPRIISTLDPDVLDVNYIQKQLNFVVQHPKLSTYFSDQWSVYNERDITYQGQVFRPDKFCIQDNSVVIIDYKTGDQSLHHQQQLLQYASIFTAMGYTVSASILVYISDGIELINL